MLAPGPHQQNPALTPGLSSFYKNNILWSKGAGHVTYFLNFIPLIYLRNG